MIVGLAKGVHLFHPETGQLTFLFHPEPETPNTRLNEGRVDPFGRLWFGVMEDIGRTPIGSLWRWSPGQAAECLRKCVHIPNGLSFDATSGVASFADNADGRVRLIDMERPEIERTLLAMGAAPGEPDGCARDRDGYVWNARFGAGRVVRIAPDGTIERTVHLPAPNVAGLCFGGSDMWTLFVTSLRVRMTDAALAEFPLSGSVFKLSAPAPGVPEHRSTIPEIPADKENTT